MVVHVKVQKLKWFQTLLGASPCLSDFILPVLPISHRGSQGSERSPSWQEPGWQPNSDPYSAQL